MRDVSAGVEPRPLGRALIWLAGLGAFFYASYGFSNWLAGLRSDVPSIVFGWERATPFFAWTILPYWTTNLFYSASFFVCHNRRELDAHGKRLLTAQIVAIVFFIVTPLKFSWPKPEVEGVFAYLFDALGAFDRPYNQAPSLHVALSVVLFSLYASVLPRWATLALGVWFALVIASVMTTYQHHFIDIPTGALLGLVCIWLWPLDASPRFASWRMTNDSRRRSFALRYTMAAVLFALIATVFGGGWLWLLWPAFAFVAVALAYLGFGPSLFAKSANGRMPWAVRLLLAPYLAGMRVNRCLWTWNEPRTVEIAPGVHLGRFPARGDLGPFREVVDMTSEFSRPHFAGTWTSIPMLDLVAPTPQKLREAARAVESARPEALTLVCCALGYGRSVTTLAVWLTRTGRTETLDEALALLREKRPRLSIHADQWRAAREAVNDDA